VDVKPRIFISYRRTDSEGHTGRLFDELERRFGKQQLFRDLDTIPLGVDFTAAIGEAVSSCAVLIAVIGRDWLKLKDSAGRRRLDDPNDFVRIEISAALERDIRVIPAIVADARMPTAKQLPKDLEGLARRNAIFLHSDSWHPGVERLIAALEDVVAANAGKRTDRASPERKRRSSEQATEPSRAMSPSESLKPLPHEPTPASTRPLPSLSALRRGGMSRGAEVFGWQLKLGERGLHHTAELKALAEELHGSEAVVEVASVRYLLPAVLVITNERLLLFQGSKRLIAVPLRDVEAIEEREGRFSLFGQFELRLKPERRPITVDADAGPAREAIKRMRVLVSTQHR
jgi:hypothetical protein